MNGAGYTSAATHRIPAHTRAHTDTRHTQTQDTHTYTHKSMSKIALAQAKTIDKPGIRKKLKEETDVGEWVVTTIYQTSCWSISTTTHIHKA